METSNLARHGDLVFKRVDSLPKGVRKSSNILALGEFTGHKHVAGKGSVVWKTSEDKTYIEVADKTEITHEEHRPIILKSGVYEMIIKREYDPFEKQINSVKD